MVIDDSKTMRMILSRTLTKLGYEVCSAGDGLQAMNYLGEHSPALSLIMVDWNMPEMNGLEFVKHVRAVPQYKSVPLMMVTTESEVEQVMKALEAGADEYVMKPFSEETILSKLRLMGVLE